MRTRLELMCVVLCAMGAWNCCTPCQCKTPSHPKPDSMHNFVARSNACAACDATKQNKKQKGNHMDSDASGQGGTRCSEPSAARNMKTLILLPDAYSVAGEEVNDKQIMPQTVMHPKTKCQSRFSASQSFCCLRYASTDRHLPAKSLYMHSMSETQKQMKARTMMHLSMPKHSPVSIRRWHPAAYNGLAVELPVVKMPVGNVTIRMHDDAEEGWTVCMCAARHMCTWKACSNENVH